MEIVISVTTVVPATDVVESRLERSATSFRSSNLKNLTPTSDVKFFKSRCKWFARSFRSMNASNFVDAQNDKLLQ